MRDPRVKKVGRKWNCDVWEIDIDDVVPCVPLYYTRADHLKRVSDSMKEHGMLNPICVLRCTYAEAESLHKHGNSEHIHSMKRYWRPDEDYVNIVIYAGSQRWHIAKYELEWTKIHAWVLPYAERRRLIKQAMRSFRSWGPNKEALKQYEPEKVLAQEERAQKLIERRKAKQAARIAAKKKGV